MGDEPELRGRVWDLEDQQLTKAIDVLLLDSPALLEPVGDFLVDLGYPLDPVGQCLHGLGRMQTGLLPRGREAVSITARDKEHAPAR